MPEFYDIDITKNLFSVLDEYDYVRGLFPVEVDDDIHVLLDEDLGPKLHGPYGFIFTSYQTHGNVKGRIGVLGPSRLNYTYIIPTVRYFRDLISEVATGW